VAECGIQLLWVTSKKWINGARIATNGQFIILHASTPKLLNYYVGDLLFRTHATLRVEFNFISYCLNITVNLISNSYLSMTTSYGNRGIIVNLMCFTRLQRFCEITNKLLSKTALDRWTQLYLHIWNQTKPYWGCIQSYIRRKLAQIVCVIWSLELRFRCYVIYGVVMSYIWISVKMSFVERTFSYNCLWSIMNIRFQGAVFVYKFGSYKILINCSLRNVKW
jgi:hypothetical protein